MPEGAGGTETEAETESSATVGPPRQSIIAIGIVRARESAGRTGVTRGRTRAAAPGRAASGAAVATRPAIGAPKVDHTAGGGGRPHNDGGRGKANTTRKARPAAGSTNAATPMRPSPPLIES